MKDPSNITFTTSFFLKGKELFKVFLEQHKVTKHCTIADEQKGFYNQVF